MLVFVFPVFAEHVLNLSFFMESLTFSTHYPYDFLVQWCHPTPLRFWAKLLSIGKLIDIFNPSPFWFFAMDIILYRPIFVNWIHWQKFKKIVNEFSLNSLTKILVWFGPPPKFLSMNLSWIHWQKFWDPSEPLLGDEMLPVFVPWGLGLFYFFFTTSFLSMSSI